MELIRDHPDKIEAIYYSNPDFATLLHESIEEAKTCLVTPPQMHQLSQMMTPPGVLAVCILPHEEFLPENVKGMRIFYLESIRDPGNLGTILRIADWFGLDFVVLSEDCVDIYNHKVLQASMGSAFRIKHTTMSIAELMTIPGSHLFVCDSNGKSIYERKPPTEGIIVFGNESLGVSHDLMHQVEDVLAIPGDRSLGAESLNVASAAAIVAAWWRGNEQ